jgi:hypothetical protein
VLCASGNGHHLFIFTRDVYPIPEWMVLLRQVCEWIGTPIIVEILLARYPVERKGTRNNIVMQLIGDLIDKFRREAAEQIVREHYRRYEHNIRSSLDEHLRAFGTAWKLMRQKLVDSLLPVERRIFNALVTEHQREGLWA